ncbi:MAG: hypothetical protein AAFR67_08240, partial [Chloroflexota bacterium]
MLKRARLRIITVFMSLTILLLIGVAYVNDMQTDNTDLVALPTVAQMPTSVPADDSSVERVIPFDMPRTDGIAGVSDDQPSDFVLPTDPIARLDSADSELPQPSIIERPDFSSEFITNSSFDSAPIDNQVIVRFRADASQQARTDYVASIGGTVVQTIEALSAVVVTIPEGTTIESLPTSDVIIERESEQYVMALSDVRVPTNDPHYPEKPFEYSENVVLKHIFTPKFG